MEQQSCRREFAQYTILSVLGTLGVSCYILADTFYFRGKSFACAYPLDIKRTGFDYSHGFFDVCFVENDRGLACLSGDGIINCAE